MPAASPINSTTDLATMTIEAGGADITQRYEVLSASVTRGLNRIPAARIVVRDGDAAGENFAAAAAEDFAPGKAVRILAGYHSREKPIFSGLIVKSAIRQTRAGKATLTIECRDRAIGMTIGRKSACYTSVKDSDVIQQLLTAHGLKADVDSTDEQLEELTQYAATDWDFLLTRAEANGLVVNVDNARVSVKAPALSAEPSLALTYGFDLLELDLEEDARTQYSSVSCFAWDPKTQKLLTSSQSISDVNPLGDDKSADLAKVANAGAFTFNTSAAVPVAGLKAWAGAQVLKSALAKIRGTVRFQGSALIEPGATLSLDGLGSRFDGTAYVGAVTHAITDGNWTTEAAIGIDPDWFAARPDVSAPPASALLPAVAGIQIGVVKKIHEDPAGHFRVLVTVPAIDQTDKAIWARLARPYATKNAGSFFYPEIGDEVALAFLDSDPRFPVIIGSLYSSSRPPPFTPDEKNTTKAIVTQAQLKIVFDETKKKLTLLTPGGNSVTLDDDSKSITLKDQSDNSVKLSPKGITLDSASDILLKAAQKITLQADAGKLIASGAAGVTVSGPTITLTADATFTATGNATASLKTSSGHVDIQGPIVMIN
jgi:Rhs element Vgr protein